MKTVLHLSIGAHVALFQPLNEFMVTAMDIMLLKMNLGATLVALKLFKSFPI